MKPIVTCAVLALLQLPLLAADPTGIWKWSTRSPSGKIPTSVKLELKNGKIAGAYSNRYGDTAISNASLQDDVIRFEVVRDLGDNEYAVKYLCKIEGDTIKGTIEAAGHDGGAALKVIGTHSAQRRTRPMTESQRTKVRCKS